MLKITVHLPNAETVTIDNSVMIAYQACKDDFVMAIRAFRAQTGLSLNESKDVLDIVRALDQSPNLSFTQPSDPNPIPPEFVVFAAKIHPQ